MLNHHHHHGNWRWFVTEKLFIKENCFYSYSVNEGEFIKYNYRFVCSLIALKPSHSKQTNIDLFTG